MTLQLHVGLAIAGDASGALQALGDTDAAMKAAAGEAERLDRSWKAADAAIGQLAKEQAAATREMVAAKAALNSGEIGLEQYNRTLLQTKAALEQVEAGHRSAITEYRKADAAYKAATGAAGNHHAAMDKATASAGAQRAGMQQLSFQIGDVAQQFALGVNPMTIFAQQGGQVVQALSLMKGGATGLIGFLGGPWGAVIMGAVTVAGMFAAKLFDTGDAARSAGADFRSAADEARGLIGAMNGLALARKQIERNKLVERGMELELHIDRHKGPQGQLQFSYTQQKELREVNWKIAEYNGLIGIAEQENAKLAASANRATAAIGRQGAATGRTRVGGSGSSAAAAGKARDGELAGWAVRAIASAEQILAAGAADLSKSFSEAFAAAGDADMAQMADGLFSSWNERWAEHLAEQAKEFGEALTELKDIAGTISFGDMFGSAGSAIDGVLASMDRLTAAQVKHDEALALAAGNQQDIAKADALYVKAKLNGTVAILGSSKKLFSEQSAMYKAITAAEKVLAAIQLVNMVKSIALDTTKTASSVANATARTAADTAAGGAKIFSFLGPFAFPVVAAMIAVMASLGFKGGGSAAAPSIPTAQELQDQAGTGTVLGDSSAKSNSIANALEIVAANSNKDLEYSNAMLKALHMIEQGIGKLAGNVARQISVAGGMFDTSAAKLGSNSSGGFLGLFGSTTTRELWDAGLDIFSSSVADVLQNGVSGQTYQVVQQIKKKSGFLGIGGSTKTTYETSTGAIDPGITEAVNGVIYSLRQGLVEASKVIGVEGAAAIIDNFSIEIGRLSFKDMTGEEIEQQLNAVFSKVGDQMAANLLPMLTELQAVGEGAFETLMRLARQYQVVDVSLRSVGLTFGAVGLASLAARDELVQLLGGLDAFVEAVNFYRENFLTEAERMAPVISSVAAEMARLGLESIDTIDRFKGVVSALDLTSQAGRDLFAALMAVAPAFGAVEKFQAAQVKADTDAARTQADQAKVLADKRRNLEISIMREMGNASAALAAQRAMELDAMDASLRADQMVLYYYQDLNKARDALSGAYSRESAALGATAARFRDFASSLRQFRDSLFAGSESGATAMLAQLRSTGAKAAGGDESALGSLSGAAQSYLDSARGNVVSLLDYKREVARVAQIVDGAIAGASGKASAAEQQLDVLRQQVEGQIELSDKVVSVREALDTINALTAPNLESLADTQVEANRVAADFQRELIAAVGRIDSKGTTHAAKTIELMTQVIQYFRRFEATGMPVTNVQAETLAVAVAA